VEKNDLKGSVFRIKQVVISRFGGHSGMSRSLANAAGHHQCDSHKGQGCSHVIILRLASVSCPTFDDTQMTVWISANGAI
jgi:hypothetical protein